MLFFLIMRGNVWEPLAPAAPPPTIGLAGLLMPRSEPVTNEGAALPPVYGPSCTTPGLRLVFDSLNLPSVDFDRMKLLLERRRMNLCTKLGRREVSLPGS